MCFVGLVGSELTARNWGEGGLYIKAPCGLFILKKKKERQSTNTKKWTFPHLSQRKFRIHKSIINSFWGRKFKTREPYTYVNSVAVTCNRNKYKNKEKRKWILWGHGPPPYIFFFSPLFSNMDSVTLWGKVVFIVGRATVLDQKIVDTQCSRRDMGGFLALNRPLQVKRHSRMKFGTLAWNV